MPCFTTHFSDLTFKHLILLFVSLYFTHHATLRWVPLAQESVHMAVEERLEAEGW